MGDVRSCLPAVASFGLPGARKRILAQPMEGQSFDDLVDQTVDQGVIGHLMAAIDSGALPATDRQWQAASHRHDSVLTADLVLERLLVATSRSLHERGIDHRALKGPVMARKSYPNPALRSFGDVDVLVEARRFDDVVALLTAEGGLPRYDEPRPSFTARFGKGVCVVTPNGHEVDLHRVFSSGPFGLAIDDRDLFNEPDTVRVADVDVPCLGPTRRFLHACYHVALGGPRTRLSAYRDVAQIAAGSVDVDAALEVATRWRGRVVLAGAADLVRTRLSFQPEGALYRWAASYHPDRFESSAMRAYGPDSAGYAVQAAAGLWAVRGVRRRTAYLSALLFPSSEYLRTRDGSYLRRARHAVTLSRRG